jgi:hypothetical protein
MTRRLIQSALVVCLFATSLYAQRRDALVKAVGSEQGFEAAGPSSEYDSTNIDTFDAALAPTLKLYGVTGITVQDWSSEGQKVQATLFQMLDSGAAYGFYTALRTASAGQPTPVLIGADSFRRDGHLYFWQSNYAVQIDGPAGAPQRLDALAKVLSRNIRGKSLKPPVAVYLPPRNIIAGSEKYLLTPEAISPSVGVDPSQLGFDSSAEAATAAYRVNGTQANLLLVLYPTQHIAKKYTDALGGVSDAFRKRAGPLFAIVYGTKNEASAAAILDDISHEFKLSAWDEGSPGLGIGTMIVTIFVFIGVALGFTLLMGLGFGGLRIFVKTRYPNRLFDTQANAEMIQLKLIQGVTDRRIGDEKRRGGT